MLVSPTPKRNDFGLNYWTIFLIKNPSRGCIGLLKDKRLLCFQQTQWELKLLRADRCITVSRFTIASEMEDVSQRFRLVIWKDFAQSGIAENFRCVPKMMFVFGKSFRKFAIHPPR